MKLIILAGLLAVAMANKDINSLFKDSNDQFTAKMFTEVVKENPDKSVILSAFSVLPPLSQLALASVGDSHDEILKAMGFPNDNATMAVFEDFNTKLRSVKGVELKMANRIYIAEDSKLNSEFADVSRRVFNSDVKNVNFGNSVAASNEINVWVEDQTNKKIKDLVAPDSIDSTTRAVLVNAIYFKGSWMNKFNSKLTKDADFYVSKDKTIKVPTMHTTASFRYGESTELDAKLLEMPYEGEESSFLIALPNKKDGIKDLQEKLKDPAALNKAQEQMYRTEVIVSLPKFKIETTTNLKKILPRMQVTKLFTPEAKLDKLLEKESNLFISEAIQKAFIEVNEEGAEAAAANAFVGLASSVFNPPPPKKFEVEKPFYFQIKNGPLPLFEGAFYE